MYAVIDLKWHQYIVRQWDKIVVDSVGLENGEELVVSEVLAKFDEEWNDVNVWTPYLKSSVTLKVLDNVKWKKIDVLKFKRKTRYQRVYWFRPHQTILQVEKIS